MACVRSVEPGGTAIISKLPTGNCGNGVLGTCKPLEKAAACAVCAVVVCAVLFDDLPPCCSSWQAEKSVDDLNVKPNSEPQAPESTPSVTFWQIFVELL